MGSVEIDGSDDMDGCPDGAAVIEGSKDGTDDLDGASDG